MTLDTDDKLREGDKVEARLKGGKKYPKGKIYMGNRDGTYDVKFGDGHRGRKVPGRDRKVPGGSIKVRVRAIKDVNLYSITLTA